MNSRILAGILLCSLSAAAQAETVINLDTAITRALSSDHRISAKEYEAAAAHGLVTQAEGADGLIFDVTAALAATTAVKGGVFREGEAASNNSLRDDAYDVDGISPWLSLRFGVIKPIYTFGKITHFKAAAKGLHAVKKQEVAKQRSATALDVSKAYFGALGSRDARYLLEEAQKRVGGAYDIAQEQLEAGEGKIKQTDIYALEAGLALINKFHAQATALENTARAGLALLTDIEQADLKLQDRRLTPLTLPGTELTELQKQALTQRPEMQQLVAGLGARRSLVKAIEAGAYPNIFMGILGSAAWSSERDRIDNPHIQDPFNHYAATPVIGLQWQLQPARGKGILESAQAELDALIQLDHLAQKGIPFEVQETWEQVIALHKGQAELLKGSKAARRWMLASYLDFEAGIGEPSDVIEALKTYVLTYSDYLLTLNEYNMQVMTLRKVTGELK